MMPRLPLLPALLGPASPLRMPSLTVGTSWTSAVIAEQGVKGRDIMSESPSQALPGLGSLTCPRPLIHVLLQELSGIHGEQPDASRTSR